MTGRAALLLVVGVCAGCDSSTRTVFGTISTTYQTPHGSTDVPVDFTTTIVQALLAGDSGVDYQIYPVLGASDGTFEIRDLPIGNYVLQIGTNYYVTDVDTFTLHTLAFGHPNAMLDNSGAAIAVTAGNLAPWSIDGTGEPSANVDQLEAYSGDAGTRGYGNNTEPMAGDIALAGFVFNDDGAALLDGDDFAVEQLQFAAINGVEYYDLTRLYSTGPVTQTTNTLTTVGDAGAMFVDETSTDIMLSQSLAAQAFAIETGFDGTHLGLVNPAATECIDPPLSFSIGGQPGDGSVGLVGGGADYLMLLEPDPSSFSIDLTGIPYPVPITPGETWTPYYSVQLEVCVPGGPNGQLVPVPALATVGPLDKLPTTISPGIGVVRKPVIAPAGTNLEAGLDLFQPQDYVGTVPTIAWLPPDIGTPTTYVVQIFEVTNNAATTIARIFTHVETLTLPPGLLQHGGHYAIAIAASDAPFPGTPIAPDEVHSASVIASAVISP